MVYPKTLPTDVVDNYTGLPFPGGNIVSQVTGAVLIANLYGDGHVEFSGNVKTNKVISGTARCANNNLTMDATVASPTTLFKAAHTVETEKTGDMLCDGDRVSINAFQSNQLPTYIGSQILNMRNIHAKFPSVPTFG